MVISDNRGVMARWPHQRLGSRVLTVNKHVNKDIRDIDRCVHIAIPPSRISSTGSIYCATTAIRALEHAMNMSSNPGGWGALQGGSGTPSIGLGDACGWSSCAGR